MKKAVIVIPTYNEADNIEELLKKIETTRKTINNWQIEILVVDSDSPDGTGKLVRKNDFKNVHLLKTKKEGLGRAYVSGFKYALNNLEPDVIFEMDADMSHDPNELPNFLHKIDGGADFVIGSRYMKGGSIPKDWSFDRKLLSVVGNLIIRLGFMKLKISDWTSGYRVIKAQLVRDSLKYIDKYSGYVFQVALLDFAVKSHAVIGHVPINFIDRRFGKSKINSIQYTIQTLIYVFIKSPFIRYALVGLSGAVIDFGLSFVLIEVLKFPTNLYWLAILIPAEFAIVFNFTANNYWSFSHKKIEHKLSSYLRALLKFNLIATGALLIQAAGVQILTYIYGPQYWWIYKILILASIVIPYSYILYNRVIWKAKKT